MKLFTRLALSLGLGSFLLSHAPDALAQNLEPLLEGKHQFSEIRSIAEAYFESKGLNQQSGSGIEDNEYVRYKRFEYFWENRVMPDGRFPDLLSQHKLFMELQLEGNRKKTRAGNWRNISQTTTTSGYEGMGRLAAVSFHPTDSNIIYVGANKGGIWRTVNGGSTWTPLGDKLPWCSGGVS